MRKILISLLIVSVFNYIGCYSYNTLTVDEINSGRPTKEDNIRFVLKDSSEIYFGTPVTKIIDDRIYLKVDEPDRYLIGKGDMINLKTQVRSNFKGIVDSKMIDSSKIVLLESQQYSVYYLKDRTRLSFEKGNYVEVFPEQGTGYYVLEPPDPLKKISFNEIKEIQTKEINWYVTGPLLALSVAAIVGLAIMASGMPTGPIDLGGAWDWDGY